MARVNLKIDGQDVACERGTTILDAARGAGMKIPALCEHPAVGPEGACRVCMVEVEGARSPVASCVYPAADGMVVRTNTQALRQARKLVVELLLARHPQECLTCKRQGNCDLQQVARQVGVTVSRFGSQRDRRVIDASSPAVVRDTGKCILCGRCVKACNQVQAVGALGYARRGMDTVVTTAFEQPLAESVCVACGRCVAVCPVAAITEKDDTDRVWQALDDAEKHVVVQVAPAVRAAIGEEFGLPAGTRVGGRLVAALRRLGFDRVFDTQFAADVTVVEEATELAGRLKRNVGLPLLTSCSPAWVRYCETFHPEFLDNVSTCKSPQQMFGALVKTYYARWAGVDPAATYSVSVMPCVAKKAERARPEMKSSGQVDVDAVLTTRELARMIRTAGIDFAGLAEEEFDAPMGSSTGAAAIFGVTGGVAEAALRTVYDMVTGRSLGTVGFKAVRGLDGIREAAVDLGSVRVRVAVVNGLSNAHRLLEDLCHGKRRYDFIEVMACPAGCVMGAGQPYSSDKDVASKRAAALYAEDECATIRKSHDNPAVKSLYGSFLGEPGGKRARRLLHTAYAPARFESVSVRGESAGLSKAV